MNRQSMDIPAWFSFSNQGSNAYYHYLCHLKYRLSDKM